MAEIDLPAQLDQRGPVRPRQPARDVGDGQQVGGDVLADPPVAAGGALDQHPALVAQVGRKAVDLRLGGEGERLLVGQAQETAHAGHELLHLGFREGVAEREHGDAVLDRGELGRRRRPDP